jgi:alpha-tubulin suppressor-like RCC1 family protein
LPRGPDSSLAIRSAAYGQTTLWEWGGNFSNPTQPVQQVTGIDAFSFADISVGGSFALAFGTDGSVWGWGDDTFGELGNGPHSGRVTRPVETFGPGSGIVQLSAGGQHTLALKSNGTVLAFGFNDTGPLGDGDRVTPPGPVHVTGMTTAVQVSAGWQFSLAVYGSVVVTKGPGI